jgi:hypothetical protein
VSTQAIIRNYNLQHRFTSVADKIIMEKGQKKNGISISCARVGGNKICKIKLLKQNLKGPDHFSVSDRFPFNKYSLLVTSSRVTSRVNTGCISGD